MFVNFSSYLTSYITFQTVKFSYYMIDFIACRLQDYVDWFKYDDALHPLSNAPEPKRRFIPSKWESKKVSCFIISCF